MMSQYLGYGMMRGDYSYRWMFFSWLIAMLVVVGLVVLIIWMIKKMQYKNHRNERRKNKLR
jgi:flagellar biogenesis protein FliO